MQELSPTCHILAKIIGGENYMVANNFHNAAVIFVEPFMSEEEMKDLEQKSFLKTLLSVILLYATLSCK